MYLALLAVLHACETHGLYILQLFILSVLGYCSYETTEEGTRGTFHWNETEVNTTASTSCFYGPNEVMATRQCVSRLTSWAAPSIDQCRTIVSTQFSNIQQVS